MSGIAHDEKSKIKNVKAKQYLPKYDYHIDENIIYLKDGKFMATFSIDGFPYESVPDEEIMVKFELFKNFLITMCKTEGIAVWTHLYKTKGELQDFYRVDNNFLQKFYKKYISNLSSNDFYKTGYYFTLAMPIVNNRNRYDLEASIEKFKEIIAQFETVLKSFDLTILGIDKNGSEISKYLSFIFNHKEYDLPLCDTAISESITNSDLFFGFDTMQIKNHHESSDIFASNYVLKDFPRKTFVGHFDFLLRLPYEFILTSSFIPLTVNGGLRKITQQLNKLNSTKNSSIVEKEELQIGQQVLQTGDNLFGSLHSVLTVFGEDAKSAKENGIKVSGEFISSGQGFRYVKSTHDSAISYFSHLPLAKERPLSTLRTVGNLACMFSLHNFSFGKETGNPIGDGTAIMPLKSTNDSIYYLNTHYSEPHKNVTGQMIAGHALILGATGTGKTTLEASASAFIQRWNPSMFVIDYNCSTELFVRAFGGQYFEFKEGEYTGLNPFQIGDADDKELVSFLKSWIKRCAVLNDGTPPTDLEALKLDKVIDSIMMLPRQNRRFSLVLELLYDASDLAIRLKKWCGNGAYAWALDSPENKFDPEKLEKIGFDTTVILEQVNGRDHEACEPLLGILFFYKDRLQRDGKLMLTIVEEFWKPANFPLTQEMIKETLKAGRMKGEMIWLTSQSPEDAINCAIFQAIVEQTSTKICLPNPSASFSGYQKIGLTQKEFNLLKKLDRDSRTMLIKQSNSSVFAKMDLHGFDDFLPILSGTKAGTSLCKKIMKELDSEDPNVWIPVFLERLKELKDNEIKELKTS